MDQQVELVSPATALTTHVGLSRAEELGGVPLVMTPRRHRSSRMRTQTLV